MSLLHKSENQQHNNDPLIRLMTQMIAGILACVFCLVSMTWAWFTASVDTPMQTIQSASRSTSVIVYEVTRSTGEGSNPTKTLVTPKVSKVASLAEDTQTTDKASSGVTADDFTWELEGNTSYEVVLTGEGDASKGYCKVEVSYTDTNGDPATDTYITDIFEKDDTLTFTYNTGIFESDDDLTATQWKERVENTDPLTLTIVSHWGSPAVETTPQVSLMSARNVAEEGIMLLSDGDVLGLEPIPCPEAKAESKVELEGFEIQEGKVISAEEDYKISLTLKEGYEMPSEVVVNIGGKDYVVSTEGSEASEEAPYYDAEAHVLTVPSALLSDGIKVSVKATATPIPEEELEEEEATEEATEEETEETTDSNETEEDNSADTSSDNNVVADDPTKKEEDSDQDSDEPVKAPTGDGGNDDDDDEADNNSGGSSNSNTSSSDNEEDGTEDEKADVKLNLSQLTINLEETQIPTNADLILTLSAKEDMELPEQIVITLDKTIRDENIDDEEIEEDKTEYIINTDGKDNPEGFEFDTESGELTISSELLEDVREITIADTEENEANEDEEKATLTFEVKNLTFDFTDDEIATDEDVVITFTAGEGYELPETIIITIDGEEYIIYTSAEDSDKNLDGITFDIETGTLTISKDLLEDVKAITITAEGVEKEDEESEGKEENPDAGKKDESEDKENTGKENESESGDVPDKEPENGTDTSNTEDKTEPESGADTPNTEDKTETEGGTDAPSEENTDTTTPETNPDTESGGDGETTTPTEPTTPAEPSEPVVTPETPSASEPATDGNDDSNGETGSADSSSAESSSNSGNDSTQSSASSESTTSTSPSTMPTAPTSSAPATSETSTSSASTQASGNTSSTPASPTPVPSTNNNSSEPSQTSSTTTSSGSKETSSEE
ncbi:MAG: hypothetical protein IJ423_00450 [Clostridia bacterium]|nr:hypothetical protein [Clostridia bacterium]